MRVAVLLAVASLLLSSATSAQTGREVLDEARRDAEYSVQSEVRARFPYNGSLYGLPGQTRPDSVRESALRAALGGMFGNCKQAGAIDLGKLPGNLNMDVGDILANTTIDVPQIKPPSGGGLLNLGSLIPKPTAAAKGQVLVGGDWMPAADYERMQAETQAALQQAAKQGAQTGVASATTSPIPAPEKVKPPVSKVWAAPGNK